MSDAALKAYGPVLMERGALIVAGQEHRMTRVCLLIAFGMAIGFISTPSVASFYPAYAPHADWLSEPTRKASVAHRVLVAASNDPELPRKEEEVRIFIPPAFEKTGAFIITCVVAIVALIGFLFWIRVKQVSTILQQRMEARLDRKSVV